MTRALHRALWSVCLVGTLAACSETRRNLVSDPETFASPDSGARERDPVVLVPEARDAGAAAAPAEAEVPVNTSNIAPVDASTAYCGKRACTCDDGQDNDGDGLSDGLDPECTGAYDDDEASFATGQPAKQQACRDCFWDANNGSGDDGCRYPAECLSNANFLGQGNCGSCAVSDECEASCKARTPNGCDCFGCCAVAKPDGEIIHIQLLDSCTLAKANDTAACPRCTPHPSCSDQCGRCELCLGKTLADLPADCRSASGPGYTCEAGRAACSSTNPCRPGFYCHQGCCLVDLL